SKSAMLVSNNHHETVRNYSCGLRVTIFDRLKRLSGRHEPHWISFLNHAYRAAIIHDGLVYGAECRDISLRIVVGGRRSCCQALDILADRHARHGSWYRIYQETWRNSTLGPYCLPRLSYPVRVADSADGSASHGRCFPRCRGCGKRRRYSSKKPYS